ncbi:MAG: tRNA/rRNA cytosine-C5-methylase, partial [Candidatus Puniceispirillaceae bacterium]
MTPAARLAAVIEIIDEMEETHLAGYGLRRGLQRRRYAGSGDRHAISAMFWQVHRAWARLFWHLQQCEFEVTARSITIAAQM